MFLVASPYLSDENFYRTVVLMVQHDSEGALGVVLNRPTESSLEEVWELFSEGPCPTDAPVYLGGPVPGPLMVVHDNDEIADTEIVPGVYVTSGSTYVEKLTESGSGKFRFFTGYSGWGAGQLDHELEEGGWLYAPAGQDEVFSEDIDELWKQVTGKIGLEILAPGVDPTRLPPDPSAN